MSSSLSRSRLLQGAATLGVMHILSKGKNPDVAAAYIDAAYINRCDPEVKV